jgi:hypothetical protein
MCEWYVGSWQQVLVSSDDFTNANLDGNLYTAGGLAHNPGPMTLDPPHRYYLTRRGVKLFIPAGAEIGDVVSSHGEDGIMEDDKIIALANATSIAE